MWAALDYVGTTQVLQSTPPLVLAADTIRESELPFPSHQEEPSLSLGHGSTQVCAFMHLFCQAPSRRLNLSCVLHLLLLQVNSGKMRQRKRLELGHLPFLQLFYFLLFLKVTFWIKRERVYFHSSPHRDFGLKRYSVMKQLLSSYNYRLLLILIIFVGFGGSLFPNKGRSPGDSEWNFFLIGNTHNT